MRYAVRSQTRSKVEKQSVPEQMETTILYHGTRYAHAILTTNQIMIPRTGYRMVSLTRFWQVAAHWAWLEREDDEGRGAS